MTQQLNFGQALEHLKSGGKVAREGWNGSKMYLQYQFPDAHSKMTLPYLHLIIPDGTQSNVAEGERRIPWQPAQVDLYSEDWHEVHDVQK